MFVKKKKYSKLFKGAKVDFFLNRGRKSFDTIPLSLKIQYFKIMCFEAFHNVPEKYLYVKKAFKWNLRWQNLVEVALYHCIDHLDSLNPTIFFIEKRKSACDGVMLVLA